MSSPCEWNYKLSLDLRCNPAKKLATHQHKKAPENIWGFNIGMF
jgi:hypothetical protein